MRSRWRDPGVASRQNRWMSRRASNGLRIALSNLTVLEFDLKGYPIIFVQRTESARVPARDTYDWPRARCATVLSRETCRATAARRGATSRERKESTWSGG